MQDNNGEEDDIGSVDFGGHWDADFGDKEQALGWQWGGTERCHKAGGGGRGGYGRRPAYLLSLVSDWRHLPSKWCTRRFDMFQHFLVL